MQNRYKPGDTAYIVESNLAKLALFLAFFPQLMEGPIARYTDTADQLWKGNPLRLTNISEGFCNYVHLTE